MKYNMIIFIYNFLYLFNESYYNVNIIFDWNLFSINKINEIKINCLKIIFNCISICK